MVFLTVGSRRFQGIVMPFAVFCCPKGKIRAIDAPCLDPMDFGVGDEPEPALLMRRGRVGMFETADDARDAIAKTGEACKGQPWTKDFVFLVLECVMHRTDLAARYGMTIADHDPLEGMIGA